MAAERHEAMPDKEQKLPKGVKKIDDPSLDVKDKVLWSGEVYTVKKIEGIARRKRTGEHQYRVIRRVRSITLKRLFGKAVTVTVPE